MLFTDRLTKFREELGLNKKELAEELGVKDAYYSMIENGKRSPSKSFLESLVAFSKKPEEYWLYGIEEDKTYINVREEFKCVKIATEQLLNLNLDVKDLFKKNDDNEIVIHKNSIEELLVAALKADIEYLKAKQNIKEQ